MPKDKKQMQELADLGQEWEFLAESLKPKEFGSQDANKLQDDILDLIYRHSGRVTLSNAVGILEVIKHNLINESD